jgi:glutamate synthase (NADPH) large chain
VAALEEQTAAGNAVSWHRGQADETQLRRLIEEHHRWTGSLRAREILDNWSTARARFVKVFPHEYKRALAEGAAKAEAAKATAKAKESATAPAK